MVNFLIGLANVLMVITSLFLIGLVLIQRGKGGGLAGAFGGAGGSSAFGTKAGDVFTRITIFTAGFWFLLALFLVYASNSKSKSAFDREIEQKGSRDAGAGAGLDPDKDKPPLATDKDKAPAGEPAVEPARPPIDGVPKKTTDGPVVPLNPADAGAKASSNPPPAPPGTPPTTPKP